jgi:hypothetical protein
VAALVEKAVADAAVEDFGFPACLAETSHA